MYVISNPVDITLATILDFLTVLKYQLKNIRLIYYIHKTNIEFKYHFMFENFQGHYDNYTFYYNGLCIDFRIILRISITLNNTLYLVANLHLILCLICTFTFVQTLFQDIQNIEFMHKFMYQKILSFASFDIDWNFRILQIQRIQILN